VCRHRPVQRNLVVVTGRLTVGASITVHSEDAQSMPAFAVLLASSIWHLTTTWFVYADLQIAGQGIIFRSEHKVPTHEEHPLKHRASLAYVRMHDEAHKGPEHSSIPLFLQIPVRSSKDYCRNLMQLPRRVDHLSSTL
jgi:hypothetical protein